MREHQSEARCLRCGRRLTAQASLTAGYGRACKARIMAAAQVADLSSFHAWQVEKAREAIEMKAVTSLPGRSTPTAADLREPVYGLPAPTALAALTCAVGSRSRIGQVLRCP
jgi:Family of unknown function (DUF6011)